MTTLSAPSGVTRTAAVKLGDAPLRQLAAACKLAPASLDAPVGDQVADLDSRAKTSVSRGRCTSPHSKQNAPRQRSSCRGAKEAEAVSTRAQPS